MGSRLEYPKFQAFDKNGNPLSGGWLFSYYPGTSTPKPLYTDALLATPWNNPVVLNSRGEALIYMDGGYKLVLSHIGTIDGETGVYTPGRIIWTVDNVFASGGGGGCSGISLSDWDCDLADAVTDLGSDAASLCVDCDCAVDADLVVPANINLRFGNGSIITVASGKTLTINNMTDPGGFQIFAGAGTVLFSGSSTVSRPEWFPNADPHYAAYALKNTGGVVKIEACEYALNAHSITETVLSSTAGIHLWPGVVIEGVSHTKSILKLADSQDCDCVRSWNYSDLTTTDTWLVINGMPTGFGVKNLSIDGNKSNNASGSGAGCRFYGKGLVLGGTVLIHDCDGPGWYSEAGSDPGNTTYVDTIQGNTGMLITCYNNGDGFTWRGPHDFYIAGINSYKNGGYALECTKEPDEYTGKLEIGWCHTFGNTDGVKIDCNFGGELLTFEDRTDFPGTYAWSEVKIDHLKVSGGNSSYFDTGGNLLTISQEQFQCNHLRVVHRWRETAIPDRSVYIDANECKIGELNVWCGKVATDTGPPIVYHQINLAVAAVEIAGIRNHIGMVQIEGTTTHRSDCPGLLVTGSYNRIGGGYISRFGDNLGSGTSGVALKIGTADGDAVNGCDIRIDTRYNLNALLYAKQGAGNKLCGHLYVAASENILESSCVSPDTTDYFDLYAYYADGTPAYRYSRFQRQSDTFDITSTGIKTAITMAHNLIWTPVGRNIQLTAFSSADDTAWSAVGNVVAVDATNITIVPYVIDASGTGGATARFAVMAHN